MSQDSKILDRIDLQIDIQTILSRHISEAIGYRNLDRSDYGTAF